MDSDSEKFRLHNVSWESYIAIADALGERPIHLTYDRGELEFTRPSLEHERYKCLFGRLIDVVSEETNTPIGGFGSMTCRRKEVERALEPDECYYLTNFPKVRGLSRIDLSRDPPPDLVVEIDITHSSLDRMGIYARLGVPEVWRFDGKTLQVHLLGEEGQYVPSASSPTFPTIPVAELVRFVRQGATKGDLPMVRNFRAWVREQLGRPTAKDKRRKKR